VLRYVIAILALLFLASASAGAKILKGEASKQIPEFSIEGRENVGIWNTTTTSIMFYLRDDDHAWHKFQERGGENAMFTCDCSGELEILMPVGTRSIRYKLKTGMLYKIRVGEGQDLYEIVTAQ
jgi:hypothetical protein